MSRREQVGSVNVDAGIIWVGDPCYVLGEDATNGVESWSDYCGRSFDPANKVAENVSAPLGEGVGLEISTTWGDGTYPVFVRRGSHGRVTSVEIVFEGQE